MPLTCLEKTADPARVADALRRDGAVVVTGLAEEPLVDSVVRELRPELDGAGLQLRSHFNGSKTLRSNRVLACAPSAAGRSDAASIARSISTVILYPSAVNNLIPLNSAGL